MQSPRKTLNLRIVILALIISVFILGIATYRAYSDDVKENISEKMVKLLPDLESGLAAL